MYAVNQGCLPHLAAMLHDVIVSCRVHAPRDARNSDRVRDFDQRKE